RAAWKAFAPIVVPVLLIGLGSLISATGYKGFGAEAGLFLGAPVTALFAGLCFALLLLPRSCAGVLNAWTAEGIRHAAPILLITGAGGAFGAVLSATPVAELIKGLAQGGLFDGPFVLVIPFIIAACLKTAQGSTTAALVVTSSLIAPFLTELGVVTPVQLALMVMAIGAGGMVVSHANDSYFWVVAQFSGLAVKDAYKAMTPATLVQGITAFAFTLLLYALLG
ncbi:MAG TPA: GntP family permease, partial [Candidatus Hydrogenedentes bacterium]|nr:GntP family permease [Candidatus Hydrogenedentota bacterium]